MISSSALFSGFISMEGLICGGATASVEMRRSRGLVTWKPRSLLSAVDIFWKMFRTLCAVYTVYFFFEPSSPIIFYYMMIRWLLRLIFVGIALPHPLFLTSSSYYSCSWNGHLLIGASNLANSFKRLVGWAIWMMRLNFYLCWSFWKIFNLEQLWQIHLRIFSTYYIKP